MKIRISEYNIRVVENRLTAINYCHESISIKIFIKKKVFLLNL